MIEYTKALEKQPCDDAVSRQAAIDLEELRHRFGNEVAFVVEDMIKGTNERWSCSEKPNRCEDAISKYLYEQIRWERDVAIKQLANLGYEFGEKIRECEDAISRQAAIDAVENTKSAKSEDGEIYVAKINAEMNIQQLPSVSTEKTGRWIRWYEVIESADGKSTDHIPHCKCSECGKKYDPHSSQFIKYCNECGVKMEV